IDFVASKRGGLLASVPERPARATATPARAISAMPDAPSLADPIKAELSKINNPAPVASSEAAGGEEKTSPEAQKETQKKPSLQAFLPSFGKNDVSKSSGSTARPKLSGSDRKFIIVLDPGHGGADPGAIGIGGTLEKDVTLSAAKSLKKHLEALGRYRVILTRSTDKWLALDQRSPIARRAEADLFLSIHADSLRSKNVRGASVYTLSDDGARRSVKVAEEDNELVVFDVDLNETDPVVRDILFDLAHEDTGKKSDLVAELMIGELGKTVPLLKNTHRREDLRVLLAPDLPSVLVELGFLSNQEDEKNLKSEAWRVRATKALARAIDAYFDEMGKDRHASVLKKSGG
ncbi:MAG: N-acetylmuramoyl-L-alanine amidase, partial [Pseudomonadota bacterium]